MNILHWIVCSNTSACHTHNSLLLISDRCCRSFQLADLCLLKFVALRLFLIAHFWWHTRVGINIRLINHHINTNSSPCQKTVALFLDACFWQHTRVGIEVFHPMNSHQHQPVPRTATLFLNAHFWWHMRAGSKSFILGIHISIKNSCTAY
jgi:hypothetical protein